MDDNSQNNYQKGIGYIGQQTIQPFQPSFQLPDEFKDLSPGDLALLSPALYKCGSNDREMEKACEKIEQWKNILNGKDKNNVQKIIEFVNCVAANFEGDKPKTVCQLGFESEDIIEQDFIQIPEFLSPVLNACQEIKNAFNSSDSVVPEFLDYDATDPINQESILPQDNNGNYYFPLPTGINLGACMAEYYFEGNDGIISNINDFFFDDFGEPEPRDIPGYQATPYANDLPNSSVYNSCLDLPLPPVFTQCEVNALLNVFSVSPINESNATLDINSGFDELYNNNKEALQKKFKRCKKNLNDIKNTLSNFAFTGAFAGIEALRQFWCNGYDITGRKTPEDIKNLKDKLRRINTKITDTTVFINNANSVANVLFNGCDGDSQYWVDSIFNSIISPNIPFMPPGVDFSVDPIEGIIIDIDPNQTFQDTFGQLSPLLTPPTLPTYDIGLNTLLDNNSLIDFCNDLLDIQSQLNETQGTTNLFNSIQGWYDCMSFTGEGFYVKNADGNYIKNPDFQKAVKECAIKGTSFGQKLGLAGFFALGSLNQWWTKTGYNAKLAYNFTKQLEVVNANYELQAICNKLRVLVPTINGYRTWDNFKLCETRESLLNKVSLEDLRKIENKKRTVGKECYDNSILLLDYYRYTRDKCTGGICYCTAVNDGKFFNDFVKQFKNKDCISLTTRLFINYNGNIPSGKGYNAFVLGFPSNRSTWKIPCEYCNKCPDNEETPPLEGGPAVPSDPDVDEEYENVFPPFPLPDFGDGAYDPPNQLPTLPPPSLLTCASFKVPYDMHIENVAEYFFTNEGINPTKEALWYANPDLNGVLIVRAGFTVLAPEPYCNGVLYDKSNGGCYIVYRLPDGSVHRVEVECPYNSKDHSIEESGVPFYQREFDELTNNTSSQAFNININ